MNLYSLSNFIAAMEQSVPGAGANLAEMLAENGIKNLEHHKQVVLELFRLLSLLTPGDEICLENIRSLLIVNRFEAFFVRILCECTGRDDILPASFYLGILPICIVQHGHNNYDGIRLILDHPCHARIPEFIQFFQSL